MSCYGGLGKGIVQLMDLRTQAESLSVEFSHCIVMGGREASDCTITKFISSRLRFED